MQRSADIDSVQEKVRVALYLRVSTDEQAREGYGLSVQEEKLRAFCQSQPAEYVINDGCVYRDEGYSGSLDIKQRPELSRLFEDAEKKKFDVVVVYRLDRFFRNTRHLLNAFEVLKSYDVSFQSATESFNTNEISGRLLLRLLASIAEAERETTRERTMSGKLKAAREGKFVTGVAPYGYRIDKQTKKLILVPEQAEVVKKIFSLVIDERLSLREVEDRVNKLGLPPPYNAKYKKRKTLNYWHKRTIGRILTNEVYTGTFYYRKYKRPFNNLTSITDKRKLRPKEEWIEMHTDPVISRERFEAAKEQLLRNREFAARNKKREYLYVKIIHCGKCGFKMFGGFQPPKKEWEYAGGRYYHGVYRNDKVAGTSKRCEWCPNYSEARLEPIWECLKEILQNPQNMLAPLEKYIHEVDDPKITKDRLTEIDKELETIKRKRKKVYDLLINERITEEESREYIREYDHHERNFTDEQTRLKQTLLTKNELADRETAVRKAFNQVRSKLDTVSYEEKAQIIRLFIERITLHAKEDYAEVVFKFPQFTETRGKKLVSQEGKWFPLVLRIKTTTEAERRKFMASVNPGRFVPKALV